MLAHWLHEVYQKKIPEIEQI